MCKVKERTAAGSRCLPNAGSARGRGRFSKLYATWLRMYKCCEKVKGLQPAQK